MEIMRGKTPGLNILHRWLSANEGVSHKQMMENYVFSKLTSLWEAEWQVDSKTDTLRTIDWIEGIFILIILIL